MTEHDFEARLREMLAARAADAPDDYPVVQQVFRDVDPRTVSPRPQRWRNWTIPLVAAGAVAAVAVAVVGVQNFRTTAHHGTPVGTQPAPTSAPVTNPPPSATVSVSPTKAVGTGSGVTHFQAGDLTFVGSDAWALGSADCYNGSGTLCTALLRSTNGGSTWKTITNPPANVPQAGTCAEPCVHNIRFATDKIGYAYGPQAFFMTTDGGTTWKSQAGGARALETLDNNVIRVNTPCFPGCAMTVETALIGTDSWTTRALPGGLPNMNTGFTLVRVASNAYLDVYGHTSGGAQGATSALFVATNDGATWSNRGEPCKQAGPAPGTTSGEVDSTAIAAGGGSLVALCTPRGSSRSYAITSTDAGTSYRRGSGYLDNGQQGPVAASGQIILADTTTGLFRSTDGGNSWHKANVPMLDGARWLGFESTTDARVVDSTGTTIWTTHNAGATWTAVSFN